MACGHVFRGTLISVAEYADSNDLILIAPANKFNFEIYEQDAGGKYLLDLNKNLKVISVPTKETRYIDTLGNAKLLRTFVEKNLHEFDFRVTLFCYKLHARRAKLAFESEGFIIDELIKTNAEKKLQNERLPFRLFYYDYYFVHWLYEKYAALFQQILIKLSK